MRWVGKVYKNILKEGETHSVPGGLRKEGLKRYGKVENTREEEFYNAYGKNRGAMYSDEVASETKTSRYWVVQDQQTQQCISCWQSTSFWQAASTFQTLLQDWVNQ